MQYIIRINRIRRCIKNYFCLNCLYFIKKFPIRKADYLYGIFFSSFLLMILQRTLSLSCTKLARRLPWSSHGRLHHSLFDVLFDKLVYTAHLAYIYNVLVLLMDFFSVPLLFFDFLVKLYTGRFTLKYCSPLEHSFVY